MPERPPHHEEDNQWVGEQIRKLRKRRDMTQMELAGEIGDTDYQKYISNKMVTCTVLLIGVS